MRGMIRGVAIAVVLGLGTLALAGVGVVFILPALVYRRWRRGMHAVSV